MQSLAGNWKASPCHLRRDTPTITRGPSQLARGRRWSLSNVTSTLIASGSENYGDEEGVSTQDLYLHPARFLKYCNLLTHPSLLVFDLPPWRPGDPASRCLYT